KKAHRGEAVVHDRRERPEPGRVRKVKEDDVQRGEGAQPGQCRQLWLFLGAGTRRRHARRGFKRGGCLFYPARYDLSIGTQAVTSEPTFSPQITLRILPGWFILKMIMGRLLSLHRLTAVVSIT